MSSVVIWLIERSPHAWQAVSMVAGIAGFILLIWDLQGVIVDSKEAYNRWLALQYKWDELWLEVERGAADLESVNELRLANREAEQLVASLPNWKWLVELAHTQMEQALGLDQKTGREA